MRVAGSRKPNSSLTLSPPSIGKAGRDRMGVSIILLFLLLYGCAATGLNERYKVLSMASDESPDFGYESDQSGNKMEDIFKGVDRLDMDKVIEIALMNNPDLHSIRARVKEVVERYPQVTSLEDPVIGIGLFPGTLADGTDMAYKIDLSQRLPYPGKLSLKGEKVLAEGEAAKRGFHHARLNIVWMVSTAYFDLFFIHQALEINEEEKNILQDFRAIATTRYATGKGNLQDSIQADVELARVEHRKIILERMLRVAVAKLNTLMGRHAGLSLPPPGRLPETTLLPDRDSLVQEAFSKNPEIIAAISMEEAARAALNLSRLQYYPDFTFMGSYNRAWMTEDLRPFIGMGVTIPIQTGRLAAQVREAEAKLNRTRAGRRDVENRVRYEVEEAYQKLNESLHASELFRKTIIPEAELHLKSAMAGYQEGRNDFLTLITAEKTLVEMRFQYERIQVDLRIRQADLLRASGGNSKKATNM